MSSPDPVSAHSYLRTRLFDLFTALKPLPSFPSERIDWIDWLMELTGYLVATMNSLGTDKAEDVGPRLDVAQRILELLYQDPRGSIPWGSAPPRPAGKPHQWAEGPRSETQCFFHCDQCQTTMSLSPALSAEETSKALSAPTCTGLVWRNRPVHTYAPPSQATPTLAQVDQHMRQVLGMQNDALEKMAHVVARLAQRNGDVPTVPLLDVARSIEEQVELITSLSVDELLKLKLDRLKSTARELLRQVNERTFEAGAHPTNDLFRVLRELPESQREALRKFPGISIQLVSALQAFWSAE